MPKVSVIIPTYNYSHFVCEAVGSAIKQTFDDREIIVVDDGSTDNTKETLLPYMSKIKYIYQENKGLPGARNTGIGAAEGEYIALLDSDDRWIPERLEWGVSVLDRNPEVGLVFSDYYLNDGKNSRIKVARPPKRDMFENLLLYNFIPCPTVLFRKKCLDEVGLFDESLARLGSEDWDLWLKIAKKYKFFYIDRPLAIYRLHPNSMIRNAEKMLTSQLMVINKALPDCKGLTKSEIKLKKKAIANIYFNVGKIYLEKTETKKARGYLTKALKNYSFYGAAYFYFLKSLLGKRILSWLKGLKEER